MRLNNIQNVFILNMIISCWFISGAAADAEAGATEVEDGASWTNEYFIGLTVNVTDPHGCVDICRNTKGCSAFTWFGNGYDCDDFAESCKLYSAVGQTKPCNNCTSGQVATDLCSESFQCSIGGNFISAVQTSTVLGCRDVCRNTPGCSYFTWYGDTTAFKNMCFLLSSCGESKPCAGCYSGPPTCQAKYCEGIEFHNLDHPTRNENQGKLLTIKIRAINL